MQQKMHSLHQQAKGDGIIDDDGQTMRITLDVCASNSDGEVVVNKLIVMMKTIILTMADKR